MPQMYVLSDPNDNEFPIPDELVRASSLINIYIVVGKCKRKSRLDYLTT